MKTLTFQTIDLKLLSGVKVGAIINTNFGFSDNQAEAYVKSLRWRGVGERVGGNFETPAGIYQLAYCSLPYLKMTTVSFS